MTELLLSDRCAFSPPSPSRHICAQSNHCRANAEAINTLCQGSAADLVKIAMIKIAKRLKEENHTDVRLLMQLHDELLYEVPESKVEMMKVS